MQIVARRYYPGRNIHCHRPMLELLVDLESFAETPTSELPGLAARLLEVLPGLGQHHCSLGYRGGFALRLEEGTYLGHVMEHMALELQSLIGLKVKYGKTRQQAGRRYRVIYEAPYPKVGEAAGRAALELLLGCVRGEPVSLPQHLAALREVLRSEALGPSTSALVEAAKAKGLPVFRLDDASFLQVGSGCYGRRLRATLTDGAPCVNVELAGDKQLTKELLRRAGVPISPGGVARSLMEAQALAGWLGWPVVVKPVAGNQGKGVSLGVDSAAGLAEAFEIAKAYDEQVLVERQEEGRHYRILVVGGRAVAAAERVPAQVVGDGASTIAELVAQVNRDPRRGVGHEAPLTRLQLDEIALALLRRQGLSPSSVPAAGQVVLLRENANLSTGGEARDVTAELHSHWAEVAVRATRLVGLDVAGIDLVTPSLSEPGPGVVVEVNAAPGIRMHLYPSTGEAQPVAEAIVEALGARAVPVISITGTNGKTTTTRMIAACCAAAGLSVGMANSDGIYLGARRLVAGDTTGPKSAQTVLMDPEVEVAVLETARGGLVRRGLGYDLADIAVVTNLSEDHLGQDGIRDLEDLFWVKSLVVEAVRPEGYVILNADDPWAERMAARAKAQICYFTLDYARVAGHVAAGGMALYPKQGYLTCSIAGEERRLCSIRKVPATLGGKALFNVQNALAAAAAALALGLPRQTVVAALTGFAENPGRLNLLSLGAVRLVVDYGHNVGAFKALIPTLRALKPKRLIGVIASPGDRQDRAIVALGQVAGAGFDYCIIKEDQDRRGRPVGEAARLLYQGCRAGGLPAERLEVVLPEREATARALALAQPGDVVVVFYEQLETVLEVAEAYRARVVSEEGAVG